MFDLIIKNATIVSENNIINGCIGIKDSKIAALGTLFDDKAAKIIDAGGVFALPGGIDPHVHIRYPGETLRETFITGTRAAVVGGVTTIIEHPISSPPQYSPETLKPRIEAAKNEAVVDVAFLGAAGGKYVNEIERLALAGVYGFKTFLHAAPEGREKEFIGLTSETNYELYNVMSAVKKTGLLMAAHGEDNDYIRGAISALRKDGKVSPINHAVSRPPIAEILAVDRLIRIAEVTGARLYLVHISTPEAVEAVVAARKKGMEIWIETCPQYLYLTEKTLAALGPYAKCNPALRDEMRVRKMWDYIKDGTIDTIGSDHSPYTVAEKERNSSDIFCVPSGFPGIENRFGLIMKAVAENIISLQRAVELISTNPAKAYDLYPQKGAIRIGGDADIVLCDPFKKFIVKKELMETMAKDVAKVYDGWELCGVIDKVILRGEVIFENQKITAKPGYGICLLKTQKDDQ